MRKLLQRRPKITTAPAPIKNLKQAAAIGIVFGLIWSFGPVVSTSYSKVLQIISVVIAAVLLFSMVMLQRHSRSSGDEPAGLPDSYYYVVMAEAVVIAIGAFLFRHSNDTPYLIAWISGVVGLHFIALSRILSVRRQIFTGLAIIVCAIVGASLWATGSTVAVSRNVTSFGTAFVLLGSAEIAVNEIRRRQHTPAPVQTS